MIGMVKNLKNLKRPLKKATTKTCTLECRVSGTVTQDIELSPGVTAAKLESLLNSGKAQWTTEGAIVKFGNLRRSNKVLARILHTDYLDTEADGFMVEEDDES